MMGLFVRLTMPQAAPPWTFRRAFQTIIVCFVVILLGATVAVALLTGASTALELTGWTLGSLLVIILLVTTYRRKPEEWDALRLGARLASLLPTFLGATIIALLLDLLGTQLTSSSSLSEALLTRPELVPLAEHPDDTTLRVLTVVLLLVLQPIAEGILFSGVTLPTLRVTFGARTGIIATGVLFGIFHFLVYPPAARDLALLWYGFGLPLVMGVVIAAVRTATGSTRAALVAQVAFGLFAMGRVLFTM